MRDAFPILDIITLPSDAADDEDRIVLDGTTNRIQVYRLSDLVGQWDADRFQVQDPDLGCFVRIDPTVSGNTVIFLHPEDVPGDTHTSGAIFANILAGTGTTPTLEFQSAGITGESVSRLSMFGADSAAGSNPDIVLAPNAGGGTGGRVYLGAVADDGSVTVIAGGLNIEPNPPIVPDITINARSLGRGFIQSDVSTGASAALAVTGTAQTCAGCTFTHTNDTGMTRRYFAFCTARFNMAGGTNGLYRPCVTDNGTTALGDQLAQCFTNVTGGPGQPGGTDRYEFTLADGASITLGGGGMRVSGGSVTDTVTQARLWLMDVGT